jgi:hypothetical protein
MKSKKLIVGFVFGLLVSACQVSQNVILSEDEVKEFHQLYNQKQFSKIYSGADDSYRDGTTEEDSEMEFRSMHGKLGKMKKTEKVSSGINPTSRGTFANLVFRTEFEKGKATERFVFVVNEKEARLSTYKYELEN